MEYILISDSKLKVMLEQQDLKEWDISADMLDYTNPNAKKVFGDILKYAKQEFGFDTSGCKVLLQLYPSKDGGCELFVTCVKSSELITDIDNYGSCVTKAYSFEKLDYLLAVCKQLLRLEICKSSSAWFDEDGRWYLTFVEKDHCEELDLLPLSPISFISEYGEPESHKALSLYLCEYASPICEENAIEVLGML